MAESTITGRWTIEWFPPQGDRKKRFTTEHAARSFAADDEVAPWYPILVHAEVKTTVTLVSTEQLRADHG